jgi:hypothetical protein
MRPFDFPENAIVMGAEPAGRRRPTVPARDLTPPKAMEPA